MTAIISEHIQITPGVCGGKPRIAGHRIRVQDVVIWYEHLHMSPSDIIAHHPSITLADVHAALVYYYDHLEEIRQDIRESEAFASQLAAKTPSILQRKLEERVDPNFPHITYRQGASGQAVAIIRGTGIRVQTIVIAANQWGLSREQLVEEYGLTNAQISNVFSFYATHQTEIDEMIATEQVIEAANV